MPPTPSVTVSGPVQRPDVPMSAHVVLCGCGSASFAAADLCAPCELSITNSRNKLTHKHTGLKDLFYALVKTQDTPPAIAVDLRSENDLLRATVAELRQTNREQAETIKRYARVVHVLEVENQDLREHAVDPRPATHSANVRFLHPPPRDDAGPARHGASTPTPNDLSEDHR